ncbi:MAG: hypothetical protein ROR55_03785 [Devosia sp.]
MTAIWALTAQAIMALLGYAAACGAAATFASFAILQSGDTAPSGSLSFLVRLSTLATTTSFVALWDAFWPTAIAIALTEGFKLRNIVVYVVAGCLIGLAMALPLRELIFGDDFPPLREGVLPLSVASGAIGGFFYWLIAGRTAGKWMEYRWFDPFPR